MERAAHEVAMLVREHWAPLLRSLIAFSGRVDLAEEALATACERALSAWAGQTPAHPIAWIRRTAQRALIDELRHEKAFARRRHLIAAAESIDTTESMPSMIDDRIEMLWLACHPALGSESRPLLCNLMTSWTRNLTTSWAVALMTSYTTTETILEQKV